MKKFLCLLFGMYLCACQGNALRIDITGLGEQLTVKSSVPGTSQGAKTRGKQIQRSIVLPATAQWAPFQIEFVSPQAAVIDLSFRSTSENGVLIDCFKGGNVVVKDGEFEKVTAQKRFAAWKASAAAVVADPKLVKSGQYCCKVTYEDRVNQRSLKIPAGEKVIFSGFYRLEKAPVVSKKVISVPAGSNVVFDHSFDKETPIVISTGRLELRPTFENCSVYLNLLPAERNKKLNVAFFFRKAGDKNFTEALPPAEVIQEHAWRGSLFNLKEDTAYEFKAVITGRNYKKEVPGTFRTRNSNVPFETILLPPGKCRVKITSGTPGKYKRYTSNGQVITLDKESAAFFELEKMENIIFDNIVIDGRGAQNVFRVTNSRNIIIRNCEIYNFGRKSAGPRYGTLMYYSGGMYDAQGNLLYDDQAFKLVQSKNVLIEKCFVHDPAFSAQTWLFAHPSGPGCLKVTDCADTVVRWNDFVGRDGYRFIDHIIGPPNGSLRGGFARDADIYGNFFAFSNDDGAELEGGAMNIRCYGNRIEGTLSGISTGPISLGPTYLIGNLFANPGDVDGSGNQAYKNGGGTKGVNPTRGKLYMLHNTVSDTNVSKYGVGCFSIPHKDYFPSCKAYLRNNLLRATGRFYHRLWHSFNTDCDGNLLHRHPGGMAETIAKDMADIKKTGLEKRGIFAEIQHENALTGNYALKKGSPGYNQALKVNNMPGFPHKGAYQGLKGEWFPKRPLDMTIDKTELHWLKGDTSSRFLTVTAPRNEKYKVIASDSFFTVKEKKSETKGALVSRTYEVRLLSEKMGVPRRYSGAILFRTGKGLALPVTLFADAREPLSKILAETKRFIPGKKVSVKGKEVVFEVAITKPGIYFLAVQGQLATASPNGKVDFTVNGQKVTHELIPFDPSGWMLVKSEKLHRLVPVDLPVGKVRFTFKSLNDVTAEKIVVTQEPWVLLRNRERSVKGKR